MYPHTIVSMYLKHAGPGITSSVLQDHPSGPFSICLNVFCLEGPAFESPTRSHNAALVLKGPFYYALRS